MCLRLLLPILLTIWIIPAEALELPGTCKVEFSGSSTLHDFAGTGACDPFVLQLQAGPGGAYMLPDSILSVPVAGMQTGNSSRDKKMREMFAADRFPKIAGIFGGGTLPELRRKLHEAARGSGTLPLRLRIRTIEAPVSARVTRLTDTPNELNFDLEFPVSLTTYKLEPPSVMGLIRVADEIRVKITMHLAPLPDAATPGGKGKESSR